MNYFLIYKLTFKLNDQALSHYPLQFCSFHILPATDLFGTNVFLKWDINELFPYN